MANNEDTPALRSTFDTSGECRDLLVATPESLPPAFLPVTQQPERLFRQALQCRYTSCVEGRHRTRHQSVFDCDRHGSQAHDIFQSFTRERLIAIAEVVTDPETVMPPAVLDLLGCRIDVSVLAPHSRRCPDAGSVICLTPTCPRSRVVPCRQERTAPSCRMWALQPAARLARTLPRLPHAEVFDGSLSNASVGHLCGAGRALLPVMGAVVSAVQHRRLGDLLDRIAAASPQAYQQVASLLLAVLAEVKPAYLATVIKLASISQFWQTAPTPFTQHPKRWAKKVGSKVVCPDGIDQLLLVALAQATAEGRRELGLLTSSGELSGFDDDGTPVRLARTADGDSGQAGQSVVDGTVVPIDLAQHLLERARFDATKDGLSESGLLLNLITPAEVARRVRDCLVRLRSADPEKYDYLTHVRQCLGSGLPVEQIAVSQTPAVTERDDQADARPAHRQGDADRTPLHLRAEVTTVERTWLRRTVTRTDKQLNRDTALDVEAALRALVDDRTPARWRTADRDPLVANDLVYHLACQREHDVAEQARREFKRTSLR